MESGQYRRVTGRKQWATALTGLAAGATVIALAARSPAGLEAAAKASAMIAGLTPLAVGVILWARRSSMAPASSTPDQVSAAQRLLADQVLAQWQKEIIVRRLDDPAPLVVRWRFTELDVVDHTEHITRSAPLRSLISRGRPRFSGRTDRIGELTNEFRDLARRRLVILGEPGMGKTTLAVLLLRELLERAAQEDPVPVLLSMSGWDPDDESLDEWVARRLAADYPVLRAATFGPDAPRSLTIQRRILPILDGLDELPKEIRPRVLLRLNEAAADPLVLTCRTREYEEIVAAPGGDVLTGGGGLEACPRAPAGAAAHISPRPPPGADGGWPDLLSALKRRKNSPLVKAMNTPLALWLLRQVYMETRANATVLFDRRRFPDPERVIEHLLDHLVDALFRADGKHRIHPKSVRDPAVAKTGLTFLARHLNTIGTRDFAWWQLRSAAPRSTKMVTGLIASLTPALVFGIFTALTAGPANALIVGPIFGLLFGLVSGIAARLTVDLVLALVAGILAVIAGRYAWLQGILAAALTMGTAGAILIAVVIAVAVRGSGLTPAYGPAYAQLRLRGRTRLLFRELIGRPRLTLRFVLTPAMGLVFGIGTGLTKGFLQGAVFGLVLSLAAWLAIGLANWAETPFTNERPQTPMTTIRRDLQLIFVKAIASGFALGAALSVYDLLFGAGIGAALRDFLSFGLMIAISIAFGVGLHQASGHYMVAVTILHARERIPLRFLKFLDSAHRLGILRVAGAAYQFRHAQLQDHLSNEPASRSGQSR